MDSENVVAVDEQTQAKIDALIERTKQLNRAMTDGLFPTPGSQAIVGGAVEMLYQAMIHDEKSLRELIRLAAVETSRLTDDPDPLNLIEILNRLVKRG